jgi:hypothetical protein
MTTLLLRLQQELALTGLAKDAEKAQVYIEQVKTILADQSEALVAGRTVRKGKGRDDTERHLEIEAAYERYIQEFGNTDNCADDHDDEDEWFATGQDLMASRMDARSTFAGDLGVDDEAQRSWEYLMRSLGLNGKSSLPLMNTVRHSDPYLVWTSGLTPTEISSKIRESNAAGSPPPNWKPLSLRWHQLVGISAAVRLLSQKGQGGILIADKVGLGKTSQTLGVIALLVHRADTFNRGLEVPGRLGKLPVGTGPHVIVMSPSLIDNWKVEAMMWLNICIEVFIYTGSESVRAKIFAPGSAWDKSTTPMFRRLILASSAVTSFASSTLIPV